MGIPFLIKPCERNPDMIIRVLCSNFMKLFTIMIIISQILNSVIKMTRYVYNCTRSCSRTLS